MSADNMSANNRQLRPVVRTVVPLPLSLLGGDNKPEDQGVEISRAEVKLAGHIGRPRPLAAQGGEHLSQHLRGLASDSPPRL